MAFGTVFSAHPSCQNLTENILPQPNVFGKRNFYILDDFFDFFIFTQVPAVVFFTALK